MRVLIREPIAEAGIELLRERFDVDVEPDGSLAPRYMGLQFQLPDRNDVLTASGVTITRDQKTVGVRFTSLPPDSAWAIESFLSYQGT